MMELAIDKNFAEPTWRKRLTGAATATVANGVLTCTAAAGESGMMDLYVPVLPGMRVEVEVYGRLVSGTAGIFLDSVSHNASSSTTPESVNLSGSDWRRYRVAYRLPHKGGLPSFIRVVLGVPSTPAGQAQFLAPTIRVDGGYGMPLVLARGMLRLENGVASLHTNWPSHGIASVSRTDANTVTVTLDHELPSSPANVRALVQISGTPDHANVPVAGNVIVGSAPTFTVKWTDGAAFVDVSGAGFRYAFFQVTL